MRDFYIRDSNWCVRVYCLDESFDSRPILGDLKALNPKDKDLLVVKDMLQNEGLNWGFTFSSYKDRKTLMVIGPAESQKEYFGTINHESFHLAKHIAQCDGLDPFSEEVAYISGGIAGEIYDAFKDIVCLCCR